MSHGLLSAIFIVYPTELSNILISFSMGGIKSKGIKLDKLEDSDE